jgi:hypothetical protein
MPAELEAELIAPDDLRLPDLSGLVDGATAVRLPARHLEAAYYDTADLRLARSGITVRDRTARGVRCCRGIDRRGAAGTRQPALEVAGGLETGIGQEAAPLVLTGLRQAPQGGCPASGRPRRPPEDHELVVRA